MKKSIGTAVIFMAFFVQSLSLFGCAPTPPPADYYKFSEYSTELTKEEHIKNLTVYANEYLSCLYSLKGNHASGDDAYVYYGVNVDLMYSLDGNQRFFIIEFLAKYFDGDNAGEEFYLSDALPIMGFIENDEYYVIFGDFNTNKLPAPYYEYTSFRSLGINPQKKYIFLGDGGNEYSLGYEENGQIKVINGEKAGLTLQDDEINSRTITAIHSNELNGSFLKLSQIERMGEGRFYLPKYQSAYTEQEHYGKIEQILQNKNFIGDSFFYNGRQAYYTAYSIGIMRALSGEQRFFYVKYYADYFDKSDTVNGVVRYDIGVIVNDDYYLIRTNAITETGWESDRSLIDAPQDKTLYFGMGGKTNSSFADSSPLDFTLYDKLVFGYVDGDVLKSIPQNPFYAVDNGGIIPNELKERFTVRSVVVQGKENPTLNDLTLFAGG